MGTRVLQNNLTKRRGTNQVKREKPTATGVNYESNKVMSSHSDRHTHTHTHRGGGRLIK